MSNLVSAHARILELVVTADESADTILVTAVNFARGFQKFDAPDKFSVPFSGGAAAANPQVELGTVIPSPSVIQITSTFQA